MGKDKVVAPSTQSNLDKFAKTSPARTPVVTTTNNYGPASTNSENQILQAIGDLRSSVETKFGELRSDLSFIRQDLRKTVQR